MINKLICFIFGHKTPFPFQKYTRLGWVNDLNCPRCGKKLK